MAKKVPKTAAGKKRKAKTIMGEFKRHQLHSGSPKGPIVKSRKQAIKIMLVKTGQAKK